MLYEWKKYMNGKRTWGKILWPPRFPPLPFFPYFRILTPLFTLSIAPPCCIATFPKLNISPPLPYLRKLPIPPLPSPLYYILYGLYIWRVDCVCARKISLLPCPPYITPPVYAQTCLHLQAYILYIIYDQI